MEEIETVMVFYSFKSSINPLTWRLLSPRVYLEFLEIQSMEHNTIVKVCPHHDLAVGEKQGVLFRVDACHRKKL